jgi:hypothetical protein
VLSEVGATPLEMFELQIKLVEVFCKGFEDLDSGRDDLGADAVGGNRCNLVLWASYWRCAFHLIVCGLCVWRHKGMYVTSIVLW